MVKSFKEEFKAFRITLISWVKKSEGMLPGSSQAEKDSMTNLTREMISSRDELIERFELDVKLPTETGLYYYRSVLFNSQEFRLIQVSKTKDGRLFGDAVSGSMCIYKPVKEFRGIFEGPIAPPTENFMLMKA